MLLDGLLAPVRVRTRNALDDCVHGVHGSIEFVNDGFAFRGQCEPVSLGLENVSNVRWSHVVGLHGVVAELFSVCSGLHHWLLPSGKRLVHDVGLSAKVKAGFTCGVGARPMVSPI